MKQIFSFFFIRTGACLQNKNVSINNGATFLPSTWYAVKDDIWNLDNWRYIDEVTTMPSELLED